MLAVATASDVTELVRMRGRLKPLAEEYDFIFLDCPPSISLVSESVFYAADALLVPVIPTILSIAARRATV